MSTYAFIAAVVLVFGVGLTAYRYVKAENEFVPVKRAYDETSFDGDYILKQGFATILVAILWPVGVPAILAILIGVKLASGSKKKKQPPSS